MDIQRIAVSVVPILVAITFHEVSHGYVANRLGDPTAKMMGRLTLNPIAHIDPVGTILVPIMLFILSNGTFVFGFAKPVPVNFFNLRKPRRDSALVSGAGPASNIIISFISILVYILLFRIIPDSIRSPFFDEKILYPVSLMLQYSITFNIFLAAFNLVPVPPLDGGRIVVSLLPAKQSYQFSKLEPFGILIVFALWFTGIARFIIEPIRFFISMIVSLFLLPFGVLM